MCQVGCSIQLVARSSARIREATQGCYEIVTSELWFLSETLWGKNFGSRTTAIIASRDDEWAN